MKTIREAQLLIAIVAALAACGSSTTAPPPGGGSTLVVASHTLHMQLGASGALPVSVLDQHGNPVSLSGVSFSVHGHLVAAVNGGTVNALEPGVDTVLIQLGTDTASIQIIVDFPAGLTHPQGTVKTPAPLGGRPFGVAVSAAGKVLATQLDFASVSGGALPVLSFTDSIGAGFIPTDVTIDAAGQYAYVTNQGSDNVGVIDLASGTQIDTVPLGIHPFRVRLTPDGSTLLISGSGGRLYLMDVATRALRDSIAVSPYINGIAIDRLGTVAYLSDRDNGTI
ncbi:MAG: YncE family protein, partial [Gemmatimonadota bacterium]